MKPTPTASWNPRLTGLSCFACGEAHDHHVIQATCRTCRQPLRADYALSPADLTPASLPNRVNSLWRYREVLPLAGGEVTLGEGWTPVFQVGDGIFIKDESRNPTGSFKARGMSAAVSIARLLGARALCAPSAGNAAGALAAYGAAAKLPVVVAMPDDTPRPFIEECRHFGAEVRLVPGTIGDAGHWLRQNGPRDAFDVSTLREPYRVEGKKTMAYELFEQFGGALPDWIIYPTGGGTGLIGMWKAFVEMEALGWLGSKRPRLVSVQAQGCAPVVKAFNDKQTTTKPWPKAQTTAYGLRVPVPLGGPLCLRALYETEGAALAVPEDAIFTAMQDLAAGSGLDICPEGGAAWAALSQLRAAGHLKPGERVVVFNTGTGLKYR